MFGHEQEPTCHRTHGTGKINCGQIRKATKCQANEFGFCSSEVALDLWAG